MAQNIEFSTKWFLQQISPPVPQAALQSSYPIDLTHSVDKQLEEAKSSQHREHSAQCVTVYR